MSRTDRLLPEDRVAYEQARESREQWQAYTAAVVGSRMPGLALCERCVRLWSEGTHRELDQMTRTRFEQGFGYFVEDLGVVTRMATVLGADTVSGAP